MTTDKSYLGRYLAGEYERVWDELVTLGATVRETAYLDDALAVARETMRRVKQNVLIPRLQSCGYVFGYQWAVDKGISTPEAAAEHERLDPDWCPPSDNVQAVIAELERRAGILPLSLSAFYEQVGGVNFVGAHPAWGAYGLDAIVVKSAEQLIALDDEFQWSQDKDDTGACKLLISPDEHMKYSVSGDLYFVRAPELAADIFLTITSTRPPLSIICAFASVTWAYPI
jgi:hypothetical protein